MRTVTLSPGARRWFDRQVDELTEINPAAARNLVKRLFEVQRLLAEFPDITERGRKKNTRKISMPPFILMSRRRGEDIEIYAIRHARQRDALAPRPAGRDDA